MESSLHRGKRGESNVMTKARRKDKVPQKREPGSLGSPLNKIADI
jgi:hypothetical protein